MSFGALILEVNTPLMFDGDTKIVLGHVIEVDFQIIMMVPTVLFCLFGEIICTYLVSCVSVIALCCFRVNFFHIFP